MSSHREAPAISQDPVADSTDVYAFVDPVNDQLVTIIANYIPFQAPDGGPNFYEFGGFTPSDPSGVAPIVYDININNDGSGVPNITYRFTFTVTIPEPTSFLYANGQIKPTGNIGPNESPYTLANGSGGGWNRPQTYTIERIDTVAGVTAAPIPLSSSNGSPLYCPPCYVGPRTTPNYQDLADAAMYTLASGEKVFAGQRADAFWVDLGAIFDLGDLRPLSSAQLIPGTSSNGINSLADTNVHTIAIQVPITALTNGTPSGPTSPNATIGVWTSASRPPMKMQNTNGTFTYSGTPVQVSRLGNPLVNEAVVPLGFKDYFNSSLPQNDSQYASVVENPELQNLLPVLYPGAFPNLAAFIKSGTPRADLVAIFATGIPAGVVPGFDGNYQTASGATPVIAEYLRLNTQIPPSANPNPLGLIAGDVAGFPNGRRVTDDIVTIELTAVAGGTIPLVDKSYTPDAVVKGSAAYPGINEESPFNSAAVISVFPYLGNPWSGFSNPTGTPANDNGASGTSFVPTTTSA